MEHITKKSYKLHSSAKCVLIFVVLFKLAKQFSCQISLRNHSCSLQKLYFFNSVFSAITMAQSEKDSVISGHGDSSVLLCVGTPLLGSLTNLDGFGKLRGECTNPVHDCSIVTFALRINSASLASIATGFARRFHT